MDRLINLADFIPFKIGQSMEVFVKKLLQNVVGLHGVPVKIVSDISTKFRLHF